MNEDQQAEMDQFKHLPPEFLNWFNSRPKKVQDVIKKCPPGKEYRIIQGSGDPVFIHSYNEGKNGDITMTVNIESPTFPRSVFGIKPENLIDI